MRQQVVLRQQLALRLELRLEQRLVLALRQELTQHQHMGKEGVEDPGRVRFFEVSNGSGGKITVVAKKMEVEDTDDPFEEVTAMQRFAEKGFAVPELLGVCESDGNFYMVTKFDPVAANLATLLEHPEVHKKFFRASLVKFTARFWQAATAGTEDFERTKFQDALKEKTALSKLPPAVLKKIADALLAEGGRLLGQELARMHEAGIEKKDITPRNILVKISEQGGIELIHTGFRHTEFHDVPLDIKQSYAHLRTIMRNFPDEIGTRPFLEGYRNLEKKSVSSVPEVFAKRKDEAAKAETTIEIQDETKRRLMALFGGKGYVMVEPKENADTGKRSIEDEMEKYVFNIQLADMQNLEAEHIYKAVYKMVETKLGDSENLPAEETRAAKVILALYDNLQRGIKADFGEIEYHDDEEIRMSLSYASRITAPLLKRYGIPLPSSIPSLARKLLVLRLCREYPEKSAGHISASSRRFFREGHPLRMAARTVGKFMLQLKDEGRITTLNKSDRQRIQRHFANLTAQEIPVDADEFAKTLNLPKDALAIFLKQLVETHLSKIIQENLAGGKETDVPALAVLFNVAFEEIERMVAEPAKQEEEEEEDLPPEIEIIEETTTVAITETMEPPPASPPVPVFEAPAAPPPLPAAPPETPAEHLAHIEERITQNPAYPDEEIARELGIDVITVKNTIARLVQNLGLADRQTEVRELIMTQPGIEDDGIQQVTGLSVFHIHLLVRPLLLGGSVRPGGPQR